MSQVTLHGAAVAGLTLTLGFFEGFGMQRSRVLVPAVVKGQMTFQYMVVMKMFLSALGSSMLAQVAMGQKFTLTRQYAKGKIGYARVAAGCSILGLGMTLAGSGPTLIPGQLASCVQSGPIIFLGALFGAWTYSKLLEARVCEVASAKPSTEPVVLEQLVKNQASYRSLALPTGLALLGAAVVLEFIFPHASNLPAGVVATAFLPIMSGLAIGITQIPVRLISGGGRGGSTAVTQIAGGPTVIKSAIKDMLTDNEKPKYAATQLLYAYGGMTSGAFVSAYVAGELWQYPGLGYVRSFLGGMLMLMGGRFAGGCTCGHGISGASELGLESWVGMACIFGAGIGSAVLEQAFFA